MVIKIVLSVCFVAISTLFGVCLSEKQRIRKKIFEELEVFNNNFLCDAALYNSLVIEKINSEDNELKLTFEGAKQCLQNGKEFFCQDKRLNSSEKQLVSSYVNALGMSDIYEQEKTLKIYAEKIKIEYLSQNLIYQKSSKLYSRLGFAFGLILVVLMI